MYLLLREIIYGHYNWCFYDLKHVTFLYSRDIGFALEGTIHIFFRKCQNWVVMYVTTLFILAEVHHYRKRWPHASFSRKLEIKKAFLNDIQSERENLWRSVFLTKSLMGTKDLSWGSLSMRGGILKTTCTTGWIFIFIRHCSLEIKKPLLVGTELRCSLILMDVKLRKAKMQAKQAKMLNHQQHEQTKFTLHLCMCLCAFFPLQ